MDDRGPASFIASPIIRPDKEYDFCTFIYTVIRDEKESYDCCGKKKIDSFGCIDHSLSLKNIAVAGTLTQKQLNEIKRPCIVDNTGYFIDISGFRLIRKERGICFCSKAPNVQLVESEIYKGIFFANATIM